LGTLSIGDDVPDDPARRPNDRSRVALFFAASPRTAGNAPPTPANSSTIKDSSNRGPFM